jgi:tape measure domain-containing protein
VATIDDKVVAISFETSKFEAGVNHVLSGLEKLKKALHFPSAGKGISDIDAAAKKMDLSHIGKAVDDIKNKFSALSVAALAVFATIATQAVQAAGRMVKAFTIDPIIQGFTEYETKLNSVQTILSNTAAAGTKLSDVNAVLAELNEYADQTIYSFSEMTRNIGTFTAAGVELNTAVGSIKGIANLAAISGSNSQQAATAMYQLSQAISAGRISLMDWNSVVNAGMGGTVFQRALAETAVHIGTLDEKAVKLSGSMKNVTIDGQSFRQSLTSTEGEQWLTGEVLTSTLEKLSGDLTDAQLKAEGYTDAQITAIQTQAKMALEAATQVKTLSQLLDTTKEALGSGWADTWQIIFGDFGEAKTLFTGLSDTIGGFVKSSADARNKILEDWKDLGGRTLLIDSLKSAFKSLGAVLAPIKDAFRDIFPAKTGQDLFNLTKRFSEFVKTLKPSPETVENLRRTFRGLFAVMDIGKQIIGGIFSVIGKLFGAITGGSGGFLALTATIGDFLVSVNETIKKSGAITGFFEGLGTVVSTAVELISALAGALADLFSTKSSGGASGAISGLGAALGPLESIITAISDAWSGFIGELGNSSSVFYTTGQAIGDFLAGLGTFIGNALSNINWDSALNAINTGLFAALVLAFKNFFGKGSFLDQFGGGIMANIAGSFKALEGSMVALQQNIKAKTLKEIAIAVALLAVSLLILSTIEPEKMKAAMASLTVSFGLLLGAMLLLEKVTLSMGFLKMPFIVASLIALAIAVNILALAVRNLGGMDWESLAKGLLGIAVLLTGLSIAAGPLSRSSAGLITAGVGITAIAIALKILASAVKDFGGMSWAAMAQGMLGVSVALIAIGTAAKLFPPNMILIGAGLVAVGISLKLIASAVETFASLSWEGIGKGMATLAGALLIIAGAMRLMPPNMILTAAGLLVVATALNILAKALQSMGGMSWIEIARGMVALGGSLLLLSVGLMAMQGSIGGAVALGVAAAGIALLAPALVMLGNQSWVSIIKGLVSLAVALALLGVAAVALTPAVPAMLGLGAALLLIGAGLALAGAGIFLIGLGLAAIAAAGPTAVAILLNALSDLVMKIPEYTQALAEAVIGIAMSLAEAAPLFVESIGKLLIALSQAIILAAPALVEAAVVLITSLLNGLRELYPLITQAGFDLIISLLTGIRNNLPQIVTLVAEIIAALIIGLGSYASTISAAGVTLIVNLLNGISSNMSRLVTAGVTLVTRFISGIVNSYGRIITAGINAVVRFVTGIANSATRLVTAGVTAITNFITGIGNSASRLVTAGTNAATRLIKAITTGVLKLIDEGAKAIVTFLNGVADAIDKYLPQMIDAGFRIGEAIVTGMIRGLANKAQEWLDSIGSLMERGLSKLRDIPLISSPSKVTYKYGQYIVMGLIKGLNDNSDKAVDSMAAIANGIIEEVESIFEITSPSKVMQKLGEFVGEGFVKGLQGSAEDINRVFSEMNQKIKDAQRQIREDIKSNRASIASINKGKENKAERRERAALRDEITKYNNELDRLAAQSKNMTKIHTAEKNALVGLANQYADVTKRLDEARQVLAAAQKQRDDFAQSTREQYAETPTISTTIDPALALERYKQGLANQAAAVQTYSSTLQQLRALGLSDRTYQKLLKEGTADQKFATQLLAGGKTAVDGLNALDAQLDGVSQSLGTTAAANLYQAGVDAAQGLVNGLASQQTAIEGMMVQIATKMVNAIKKKLKIKSPSKVFKQLGDQSMEGLATGLTGGTKMVTDATEDVSTSMIDSMKESMAGLSDALSSEIDADPTITPVLDLSQVQQDADSMKKIMDNLVPITAASSYGQAATISAAQKAALADAEAKAAIGTNITFEQNNYSPQALTPIEIYRQTQNLLAQAKRLTLA